MSRLMTPLAYGDFHDRIKRGAIACAIDDYLRRPEPTYGDAVLSALASLPEDRPSEAILTEWTNLARALAEKFRLPDISRALERRKRAFMPHLRPEAKDTAHTIVSAVAGDVPYLLELEAKLTRDPQETPRRTAAGFPILLIGGLQSWSDGVDTALAYLYERIVQPRLSSEEAPASIRVRLMCDQELGADQSFSLPVALAATALLFDEELRPTTAATGAIDGDGLIEPSGTAIRQKVRALALERPWIREFLVPPGSVDEAKEALNMEELDAKVVPIQDLSAAFSHLGWQLRHHPKTQVVPNGLQLPSQRTRAEGRSLHRIEAPDDCGRATDEEVIFGLRDGHCHFWPKDKEYRKRWLNACAEARALAQFEVARVVGALAAAQAFLICTIADVEDVAVYAAEREEEDRGTPPILRRYLDSYRYLWGVVKSVVWYDDCVRRVLDLPDLVGSCVNLACECARKDLDLHQEWRRNGKHVASFLKHVHVLLRRELSMMDDCNSIWDAYLDIGGESELVRRDAGGEISEDLRNAVAIARERGLDGVVRRRWGRNMRSVVARESNDFFSSGLGLVEGLPETLPEAIRELPCVCVCAHARVEGEVEAEHPHFWAALRLDRLGWGVVWRCVGVNMWAWGVQKGALGRWLRSKGDEGL
jgi:hypothetical protein